MSGRLILSLSLFLPGSQCRLCIYKEVIKPQIYHFHVKVERDTQGEESKEKKHWGLGQLLLCLFSKSFLHLPCSWRKRKKFRPIIRCHVSARVTDEITRSEWRVRGPGRGSKKSLCSQEQWTTAAGKDDPLLKLVNLCIPPTPQPPLPHFGLHFMCLSLLFLCMTLLLFHFSLVP